MCVIVCVFVCMCGCKVLNHCNADLVYNAIKRSENAPLMCKMSCFCKSFEKHKNAVVIYESHHHSNPQTHTNTHTHSHTHALTRSRYETKRSCAIYLFQKESRPVFLFPTNEKQEGAEEHATRHTARENRRQRRPTVQTAQEAIKLTTSTQAHANNHQSATIALQHRTTRRPS